MMFNTTMPVTDDRLRSHISRPTTPSTDRSRSPPCDQIRSATPIGRQTVTFTEQPVDLVNGNRSRSPVSKFRSPNASSSHASNVPISGSATVVSRSKSPIPKDVRSWTPKGRPAMRSSHGKVGGGGSRISSNNRSGSGSPVAPRSVSPQGVTIVPVRPRSTPPDISLNVESKRYSLLAPVGQSGLKTSDPRTRFSVGDLQTLLRNGYAADPDDGMLQKSWSGSRRKLSVSLEEGLVSPESRNYSKQDSGDHSDSGLGDDLWWQYKSILQRKKKLVLEEHTTWVNGILRSLRYSPVQDLCVSVSDGTSLAKLIEILTNEKVPVAHGSPVQFGQKAENLQLCLEHLGLNGVDIQGINGHELAEGNLKSTLVLMNNLRKRYESPQGYPQRSTSGDREKDPHQSSGRYSTDRGVTSSVGYPTDRGVTSSAGYPTDRGVTSSAGYPTDRGVTSSGGYQTERGVTSSGGYQTERGVTSSAGYPNPRNGSHARPTTPVRGTNHTQARGTPELSADLIPGSLTQERPPPRPQPPYSGTTSTTELHKDEVIHHNAAEGRSHSHVSKAVEVPRAGTRSQTTRGYGGGRQSQHARASPAGTTPPPPPTVAAQAWQAQGNSQSSAAKPSHTATGASMESRLHHSQHNSHKSTGTSQGVTNGAYVYDDGELLVPPKPREAASRDAHRPSSTSYVPSQKLPEGPRSSNLAPHFNSQYPSPQSHNPPYQHTSSGPPLPNYLPPPQYNRPASQPQGEGYNKESPLSAERGGVMGKATPPPPHRSSSHPLPGDPQYSGNIPGNRNGLHGNRSGPTSNRETFHDATAARPMYARKGPMNNSSHSNISNGRTSPQGQSSTPASQSPNHDQLSPPGQGYKNYVNSSAKDSHHITSPHEALKANIQNQKNNTDLIIKNSGVIGPSSTYPHTVSMNEMTPSQPDRTGKKTSQNGGYTRTGETFGASPMTSNGNVLKTVSNETNGRWNPQVQHGSKHSGKHANEIELQKLSKDRPPSRGPPIAEPHWNGSKPDIWDGRPVIRASADQWEDSDDSSITPPLPPLSPSNTPPVTPPLSPIKSHPSGPGTGRFPHDYGSKTPDILIGKGSGQKRRPRRSGTGTGGRMDGSWNKTTQGRSTYRSPGRTVIRAHPGPDLDSGDNGSTTNASGTEDWDDTVDATELTQIRSQMEGLETMYAEILKMIGLDKEYLPGSRRSISSMSSTSRVGGRRSKAHMYSHRTARELRQVNKRFSRLESHVVTLARSVAHLSSEMRSQNGLYQELEDLKKDIRQLKKERHQSPPPGGAEVPAGADGRPVSDWERFRGWIPSISNSKRVKKLAKFFGQDRMLHYFLEKLGYQKYIKNFEAEEITILELPYMNEDRLQKLGIPMGPRQRILQEAQMCFRQENFSIYIV